MNKLKAMDQTKLNTKKNIAILKINHKNIACIFLPARSLTKMVIEISNVKHKKYESLEIF